MEFDQKICSLKGPNSYNLVTYQSFSGIYLETWFWLRLRVSRTSHDCTFLGKLPLSWFWSSKRFFKWGRVVNPWAIVPIKRLLLASNSIKLLQEDTPVGMLPENQLLLIWSCQRFSDNFLGSNPVNKLFLNIKLPKLGDVHRSLRTFPESLLFPT